ncbi:MAG: tetratricopeptide repeat protein [Prevotella sp.]|nr:tetratricopeptide repeat protein [Prevotella sp.]
MQKKYFNTTEFKDLLTRYEDALRAGEQIYMDASELTDIAEYYHSCGNDHAALQVADYALRLHPGALGPCLLRARMCLMKADTIGARFYIENVDDKLDQEYDYLMAEILLSEGKVEKADELLHQKYQSLEGEDAEDFVIDAAYIFVDYNLPEKAEKWFLMSNEDDSEDYQELKGRLQLWKSKYAEAIDTFNTLINADPFNVTYWNLLSATQFAQNDLQHSIESSEYAIAIDPSDAEAIFNKANGLYALSNYEKSLEYCRRYTELRPNDFAGYMYQGSCMYSLKRMNDAALLYQKAIDMGWQDGYAYLALCHYELGDELRFVKAAVKAVEVDPKEAASVLSEIAEKELTAEDLIKWVEEIVHSS